MSYNRDYANNTLTVTNENGVQTQYTYTPLGLPQDIIDIAQYGKPAREVGLPVAEYKINHRCAADSGSPAAGRGVYTFCMCPGRHVVAAASEKQGMVVNGMSYHDRDSGVANSALLCDVRTSDFGTDDVLAGVAFQEKYEHLAYEVILTYVDVLQNIH